MNPNDKDIELKDALGSFSDPVEFDEKSITNRLLSGKPVFYCHNYIVVSISLEYFVYTVKSTHGVEERYNALSLGEGYKAVKSFMDLCRFIKSRDI